jgi:hypothetical protein
MVDDDDPKSGPAPTGAPADTPEPEADTEPEGDEPEGDTETSEASDADEEADDDASDDADDDDGEDDGDDGDEPKRKKSSRNERYKRQAERLKAENEALRSRSSNGSLPQDDAALVRAIEARVQQEIGEPPKQDDFKGDYIGFEREMQAYLSEQRMVRREVKKQFVQAVQTEQNRMVELVADHKARVAKFKTQIKDFDEVMAKATVPVAPHVERLILHSNKSHRIGYVLAKDQALLTRLNHSSPEEAARELGRIEGRLSLPQKPKQTQARKPIVPLKGGSARPQSQTAARDAYLKKLYGDRV